MTKKEVLALEEKTRIQERLEENYKISDRFMAIYVLVVLIYQIALSFFYDQLMVGTLLALGTAVPFFLTIFFFKRRRLKNNLIGLTSVLVVASGVAAAKGLLEARYLFFLSMAMLVLYQNRSLIIWGGAVALVFNLVTYPIALYDLPGKDLVETYMLEPINITEEKFFLTFFFLAAYIMILAIVAQQLRKRTIAGIEFEFNQERQLNAFEENRKIADEIAQGNLNDIVIVGQDDLGKSLRNMLSSLRSAQKKERRDRYISEGLSEVNRIMREEDHTEAFRKALVYIGKHTSCQAGLLLTVKEGQEKMKIEDSVMNLRSYFGANVAHLKDEDISMGDGMLGQACLEKKVRLADEIPDTYLAISSGLGQARPKNLLFVPLIYNEMVLGGMELATLSEVSEEKTQFLEQAATIMGAAVLEELVRSLNQNIIAQAETKAQDFEKKEQGYVLKVAELEEKVRKLERGEA